MLDFEFLSISNTCRDWIFAVFILISAVALFVAAEVRILRLLQSFASRTSATTDPPKRGPCMPRIRAAIFPRHLPSPPLESFLSLRSHQSINHNTRITARNDADLAKPVPIVSLLLSRTL